MLFMYALYAVVVGGAGGLLIGSDRVYNFFTTKGQILFAILVVIVVEAGLFLL